MLSSQPFSHVPISLSEVKWKSLSRVRLFETRMDYTVHGILQARILEWVASHSLLQEIFPTQVSCIAGRVFTS